jgi:hypothetical protein
MYKIPRGRFQAWIGGGGGAGAFRNLIALLMPLRCIKELNRPARDAPPILKNLLEIKRKL